jgi:hypothetical protein
VDGFVQFSDDALVDELMAYLVSPDRDERGPNEAAT